MARRCGRRDARAHPCASTTRRCCRSCRTRSRPRDLGEAGTWAPPSSAQSPTADSRSKTASSCPRTSRTHPPRARCRSCLEASVGASRHAGRARREAGGLAGVSAGRPCGGARRNGCCANLFRPETRSSALLEQSGSFLLMDYSTGARERRAFEVYVCDSWADARRARARRVRRRRPAQVRLSTGACPSPCPS